MMPSQQSYKADRSDAGCMGGPPGFEVVVEGQPGDMQVAQDTFMWATAVSPKCHCKGNIESYLMCGHLHNKKRNLSV